MKVDSNKKDAKFNDIENDELMQNILEGIRNLKKNTQQLLEEDASILDNEQNAKAR
jgi:hypothetical protein